MTATPPWSDAMREQFLALTDRGADNATIMAEMDLSYSQLARARQRFNRPGPDARAKVQTVKWTDERKAEFRALHEAGFSPREIATRMGLSSVNAVAKQRQRQGLTPQPPATYGRKPREGVSGPGMDLTLRSITSRRTWGRKPGPNERVTHCKRPPLPPGSTESWALLTEGTLLEGQSYER